jgi:signal transduction histidine kinase
MDTRASDRIAEEQAALRRVATLAARGASPEEMFGAVTAEVTRILDADVATLGRYDPDKVMTTVARWSVTDGLRRRRHCTPLGGRNLPTLLFETGRPGRIDDYSQASGPAAEVARRHGIHSTAGAPVSVEGRLWGVMLVSATGEKPLPPDAETRLAGFTELVGTAIANAQARVDLRGYADEQAALRRVATLVAHGAPPEEVFAAVAAEAGRLLGADETAMARYDLPEKAMTTIALWSATGDVLEAGYRTALGGQNVSTLVLETGRSVRMDDLSQASGPAGDIVRRLGIRSSAGVPISVEGGLWGVMTVASTQAETLPADTEARLAGFTELVGTAIANAQARVDLRGYADEQAALRRVATLVAHGAPPEKVFAAVSEEIGRVVSADFTGMTRYDADGVATPVGMWTATDAPWPVTIGDRLSLGGRNVTTLVRQTGQPAWIDDYGESSGTFADAARDWGFHSSIGVPITVDGRLWGVVIVASARGASLPADTETRLAGFTELVGTAIANAEAQAALAASRARLVAAADEARRRIERDLHDGAQQRLVTLALRLREAQATAPPEAGELVRRLDDLAAGLNIALEELREIARGIHPAVLARGGLGAALAALARRCAVPVDLRVQVAGRLPGPVEITAYYVVCEALTNTAKHAEATAAEVTVEVIAGEGVLRVCVRDDGRGGAAFSGGSGLLGLKDRVEASGGRIWLHSPPGQGTTLEAHVPLRELENDRFRYTNRDHTTR